MFLDSQAYEITYKSYHEFMRSIIEGCRSEEKKPTNIFICIMQAIKLAVEVKTTG